MKEVRPRRPQRKLLSHFGALQSLVEGAVQEQERYLQAGPADNGLRGGGGYTISLRGLNLRSGSQETFRLQHGSATSCKMH